MSNDIAISVENLSKKYRIGGPMRHNTIRDQIDDFVHHPFGIGKQMATSEDFWALKDVSFDIKKGDVVGVIGRNGSGKSTLLKILSRIVEPTAGKVTMHGRVASLLEVGTGFNPDLTGRENIFLNGSILGMSQKEIAGKYNEIVAFSGVEQFIDTPVKRYSSGMYVRLAFAVAAHLDSDILLVDEVLAVGDAEFQKKCLGKMKSLANGGRTVLFVSHDLNTISKLCNQSILLDKGEIISYAKTSIVVRTYARMNKKSQNVGLYSYPQDEKKVIQVTQVETLNINHERVSLLPIAEDFLIRIDYIASAPIDNCVLSLIFYSAEGSALLLSSESDRDGVLRSYEIGMYQTTLKIPSFLFNLGITSFDVMLHTPQKKVFDNKSSLFFEVINTNNNRSAIYGDAVLGSIATVLDYKTTSIKG